MSDHPTVAVSFCFLLLSLFRSSCFLSVEFIQWIFGFCCLFSVLDFWWTFLIPLKWRLFLLFIKSRIESCIWVLLPTPSVCLPYTPVGTVLWSGVASVGRVYIQQCCVPKTWSWIDHHRVQTSLGICGMCWRSLYATVWLSCGENLCNWLTEILSYWETDVSRRQWPLTVWPQNTNHFL